MAEASVDVWVDSSVVRRLLPDVAWKQAGISVLRVPLSVCSTTRPMAEGKEVFLGSDALTAQSFGQLDFHGTGDFRRVGLGKLVPVLDDTPPPPITRRNSWR
ncbi:hypothetical protein [Pseudoxanthomonas sp.]|uniref:hypothetical protein n=1 Tax=Pseudoxanthomonas sp. TaxID=1871049 RepID=UPI003F808CC1